MKIKLTLGAALGAVLIISGALSIAAAKTKQLSIPKIITKNHYGFLSAGSNDAKLIKAYGARWVRPHPGPFLWDSIQRIENGGYDFSGSDYAVIKYSKKKIGILATIWPFAEWDQLNKADPDACQVSDKDIFLPSSDEATGKGRTDYLPEHRCLPNDLTAYTNWVKALVERYDGDGQGDMKGLKIPIKYWEVMNEPDLTGDDTLDFWKGDEADYATLLTQTYAAIKSADPSANVLIAGAAGGDDQFLDFYRTVFNSYPETQNAFDIANVHCISSGFPESLNVEPYKNMLTQVGLAQKPIWVTEAEYITSSDYKVNAAQTRGAVRTARQSGASRIFFTRYGFSDSDDYGSSDQYARKQYKKITKIK